MKTMRSYEDLARYGINVSIAPLVEVLCDIRDVLVELRDSTKESAVPEKINEISETLNALRRGYNL